MAETPDGKGYWQFLLNGAVFAFGDAGFFGSEAGQILGAAPFPVIVVGIAATPDGQGYWLVDNVGNVFSFGDAQV